MAVESGSVTLRRLYINGKCKASSDASWIENLKANAFSYKKLKPDDENQGFAVMGNELSSDFNLDNSIFGKYVLFSLRKDVKKIQRTLLNLHVKERIKERLKELEADTISQKQKGEIKNEVLEELNQNTPESIQILQVIIDTARKEVFISSTSDKMVESVEVLFNKAFGIKLIEANSMATAQNLLDADTFEEVLDNPGYDSVDGMEVHPDFQDGPEAKLGSGFLTWLYYYLNAGEGTWKGKSVGEFGIIMNDYLLLEGEALGSKQTLLKKGLITKCAELSTAFNVGKQVSKVKMECARDNGADAEEQWVFTIDKANFDLSSLKVPKYSEGNQAARTLGRLNYIIEAFEIIDEMFLHFLELRYSNKWKSTVKELKNWIGLLRGNF